MTFDFSVNVGTVISAVGLVITLMKLHNSNVRRMEQIETKMDLIYRWFEKAIVLRTNSDERPSGSGGRGRRTIGQD